MSPRQSRTSPGNSRHATRRPYCNAGYSCTKVVHSRAVPVAGFEGRTRKAVSVISSVNVQQTGGRTVLSTVICDCVCTRRARIQLYQRDHTVLRTARV